MLSEESRKLARERDRTASYVGFSTQCRRCGLNRGIRSGHFSAGAGEEGGELGRGEGARARGLRDGDARERAGEKGHDARHVLVSEDGRKERRPPRPERPRGR